MEVLCDLVTKKIEAIHQEGDIPHNPGTHVQITTDYEPDVLNERLNDTGDGLRVVTQLELDEAIDEQKTLESDIELIFDSTMKAFALVVIDEINILRNAAGLNERTIVQLKAAIKNKL